MTNTALVFQSRGQARGGISETISTAAAVTYTVDQMYSGLIKRNPNGAARADLLPTGAAMIAGLPGAVVGTLFEFTVKNISVAAGETITLTPQAGVTTSGTMTIAITNARRLRIEVTSATPGAEAYTIDSISQATPF